MTTEIRALGKNGWALPRFQKNKKITGKVINGREICLIYLMTFSNLLSYYL